MIITYFLVRRLRLSDAVITQTAASKKAVSPIGSGSNGSKEKDIHLETVVDVPPQDETFEWREVKRG